MLSFVRVAIVVVVAVLLLFAFLVIVAFTDLVPVCIVLHFLVVVFLRVLLGLILQLVGHLTVFHMVVSIFDILRKGLLTVLVLRDVTRFKPVGAPLLLSVGVGGLISLILVGLTQHSWRPCPKAFVVWDKWLFPHFFIFRLI